MPDTTKAERLLAHVQALASTRIEGHMPMPEFLADCAAVIEGTMTRDQARAASLDRALAKDLATHENSRSCTNGTTPTQRIRTPEP